jgi:hypothetical protein
MADKPKRVREQAMVYLTSRDAELLDQLVAATGLPKTELFRRGLQRLADDTLGGRKAGSSLAYLISSAQDDGLPPDVAERHDYYLHGGGYGQPRKPKRARSR